MSTRYLRAEELARLAGLAKSTVLAAIRRGEIRSSRTLGRGTRIPVDSAREYLTLRGRQIPGELREASASSIAVVTERADLGERVQLTAGSNWSVTASSNTYGALLWIGAHAPAWVMVDFDMALLNPFEVLRAVQSLGARSPEHVVAIAAQPAMLAAARSLGAQHGLAPDDVSALGPLLHRPMD